MACCENPATIFRSGKPQNLRRVWIVKLWCIAEALIFWHYPSPVDIIRKSRIKIPMYPAIRNGFHARWGKDLRSQPYQGEPAGGEYVLTASRQASLQVDHWYRLNCSLLDWQDVRTWQWFLAKTCRQLISQANQNSKLQQNEWTLSAFEDTRIYRKWCTGIYRQNLRRLPEMAPETPVASFQRQCCNFRHKHWTYLRKFVRKGRQQFPVLWWVF